MERLTKYLASGAADYNYPAGCYSGNDCNDRVAKSAYRQTCVERLAAYEETGLTPEESKRMSNILMDVGIDYNCSWEYVKNWLLDDRLRELDEADKDGRLVVPPCKVGDTVWANLDGMRHPRECVIEFVNIGSHVTTIVFSTVDGLREQYGVNHSSFGKTVFFTREKAEKALEAMKDG
jgi:hypothetical protein